MNETTGWTIWGCVVAVCAVIMIIFMSKCQISGDAEQGATNRAREATKQEYIKRGYVEVENSWIKPVNAEAKP